MILAPKRQAALLVALTFSANLVHAEVPKVEVHGPQAAAPAQPAELKYPPIRLEVAEASLTDPQKATKDELIEGSQVFEDAIHRSGAIYRDPELERVVNGIVPIEQLGERAKGFHYRIYVVKDPTVNAMTTPTGSIYVNSGLLAAMENLDQLRLTLAHEVHHILDQDVVHRYKKFKDEVGAIRFAQLVASPIIAVAIGESGSDAASVIAWAYTGTNLAISISYQLAFLGYGRENENECDLYAMKLFKENGYELENARRTFVVFEEEREQYGKGFQSHFLSTHETGKQRAERVEKFMKELGRPPSPGAPAAAPDPRYDRLTHEVRIENARLNVKVRRPQHAIADLEELAKAFPDDARVPCLLGQVYAMISEDHKILQDELSGGAWKKLGIKDLKKQPDVWREKAVEYYSRAIQMDPLYADPHRELGLLKEAKEEHPDAIGHLQKYLALNPQGKDVRFVKARITKIERLMEEKEKKRQEEEEKKAGRRDNYRSTEKNEIKQ